MSETTIRTGSLRGIMMRGPGLTATLPFYEDMWGLKLAHREDAVALLRGTGTEPFLYGLTDGDIFGIEYVHFAMPDRASTSESPRSTARIRLRPATRRPSRARASVMGLAPVET